MSASGRSGVASSSAPDLLGRIERRSVTFTVVALGVAALVPGGGLRMAGGVGGGAVLALTSYWAIKQGVTGIADAILASVARRQVPASSPADIAATGADGDEAVPDRRDTRRRVRRGMVLLVCRYALLAGIAYVMIARLRLPPIGLLCGASVTMLAAAAELLRRQP